MIDISSSSSSNVIANIIIITTVAPHLSTSSLNIPHCITFFLCTGACACARARTVYEECTILFMLFLRFSGYSFVDLVKCGVLTLVDERGSYRNEQYIIIININIIE